MDQVKNHISTILTPKDLVSKNSRSNCLFLTIATNREELTRKWIGRRYKIQDPFKLSESASAARGRECRLKIEKLYRGKSRTSNFELSRTGQLSQIDEKGNGVRTTSLLLSSGRRGSIRYNDEVIGVMCIRGGQDNYQIEIIVDSDEGGVSTSTSLIKGQKLNIGQIVDKSKNRASNLSLRNGVKFNQRKSESRYDYYLMID